MVNKIKTQHRSAQFYLGWFFKCYRSSEQGWYSYQTPDNGAIMDQDAFFTGALETIGRTMNRMMLEESQKATQPSGSRSIG